MRILLFLICVLLTACGSKRIDEKRQFDYQQDVEEQSGISFESSRSEALKYQKQLFDFTKLALSFSAPDSLPYYFRLGNLEYFGSGKVDLNQEDISQSEENKQKIIRDTIVIRDTITRVEYVAVADRMEKKEKAVKGPSFWWYVVAFGIGLVTPKLVKLSFKALKPI